MKMSQLKEDPENSDSLNCHSELVSESYPPTRHRDAETSSA